MEVPKKILQHVSSKNKLKPSGSSIESYAGAIAKYQQDIGKQVVASYRYAGRTTISLYKPLVGIDKRFNSQSLFKNYLVEKYGSGIFAQGLTPDIMDKPIIYSATELGNKIILCYTYLGQERRVFRQYKIVKERPQVIDYIVVHFNPLAIELRVPQSKALVFIKAFLETIDGKSDAEWFNLTELSNREAKELIDRLEAGLKGAKHKMPEGPYDTVEVRANINVEDLFRDKSYQEEFSNTPYKNMTVSFSYSHNIGLEEKISLRINPKSINFYSAVSEEIIDYMIDNIFLIKHETTKQITSAMENV